MRKFLAQLVCIGMLGTAMAWAGEPTPDATPRKPSPEDMEIIAMLETLMMMDLAREMEMVKEMEHLDKEHQDE